MAPVGKGLQKRMTLVRIVRQGGFLVTFLYRKFPLVAPLVSVCVPLKAHKGGKVVKCLATRQYIVTRIRGGV